MCRARGLKSATDYVCKWAYTWCDVNSDYYLVLTFTLWISGRVVEHGAGQQMK